MSPPTTFRTDPDADLSTRLTAMHRQVALGRESARWERLGRESELSPALLEELQQIERLCGRMDLALSEVDGKILDFQRQRNSGRIEIDDSFERERSQVIGAVHAAKIQHEQLLGESLKRWDIAEPGAEYAWLQFHAHFDLLGEYLDRLEKIVAEEFAALHVRLANQWNAGSIAGRVRNATSRALAAIAKIVRKLQAERGKVEQAPRSNEAGKAT